MRRTSCKSVLHVHVCLLGLLPLRSDATRKDAVRRPWAARGRVRVACVRRRRDRGPAFCAYVRFTESQYKGVTSPPAQAKQSGLLAVAVAPVPVPLAWREAGH